MRQRRLSLTDSFLTIGIKGGSLSEGVESRGLVVIFCIFSDDEDSVCVCFYATWSRTQVMYRGGMLLDLQPTHEESQYTTTTSSTTVLSLLQWTKALTSTFAF